MHISDPILFREGINHFQLEIFLHSISICLSALCVKHCIGHHHTEVNKINMVFAIVKENKCYVTNK